MEIKSLKTRSKKIIWKILNSRDCKGLCRLTRKKKLITGVSRLIDCSFQINGNGSAVIIGDGCVIKGLNVLICGDNTKIVIGDNVHINASKRCPTIFNAFYGANITIGNDCLFSNSIELHTTDYHSIISARGGRLNYPKKIQLGEHVWVGLRTLILKGTVVESNNIIGAGSIVSGTFPQSNTIICGVPAKVIKDDVNWDIRNLK